MRNFNNAFRKSDNYMTPRLLVDVIVPFVMERFKDRKAISVWCPFDTEESQFVKAFQKQGCNVIFSHIDSGQDFFCFEPSEDYDVIVSNPPFSRKLDVFKRCELLGKPYALLMNMMAINYQEIGEFFAGKNIQFVVPDKKVSFDGRTSSFCSGYVCNFLARTHFVHLPHNNTGAAFHVD